MRQKRNTHTLLLIANSLNSFILYKQKMKGSNCEMGITYSEQDMATDVHN